MWGIDITYLRLQHGWLYLVAIIDGYSRYVVAWELSETLELPFVLTTAKRWRSASRPFGITTKAVILPVHSIPRCS